MPFHATNEIIQPNTDFPPSALECIFAVTLQIRIMFDLISWQLQ